MTMKQGIGTAIVSCMAWLSASCQKQEIARGKDAWFSEKKEILLQDENGQVYALKQHETESNVYTVWIEQGETKGVKESLAYRMGLSR